MTGMRTNRRVWKVIGDAMTNDERLGAHGGKQRAQESKLVNESAALTGVQF
jgi:hypothetical protein